MAPGSEKRPFGKPKPEPTPIKSVWGGRKRTYGVDFTQVDGTLVVAALASVTAAGNMLAFSDASGGLGVCLTFYEERNKTRQYAKDAAQLADLLNELIDYCDGSSQDTRAMFGRSEADRAAAD